MRFEYDNGAVYEIATDWLVNPDGSRGEDVLFYRKPGVRGWEMLECWNWDRYLDFEDEEPCQFDYWLRSAFLAMNLGKALDAT